MLGSEKLEQAHGMPVALVADDRSLLATIGNGAETTTKHRTAITQQVGQLEETKPGREAGCMDAIRSTPGEELL